MRKYFKTYATTDAEREAVARSFAAHNIKTAEDFAAYCRPSRSFLVLLAVVFGVIAGAFAPVFVPGVGVGSCLLAAVVGAGVSYVSGRVFCALMD